MARKRHIFVLWLGLWLCATAFAAPPRVLQIYPTTAHIPVNILRFYIRFSAPMQETGILRHIHLSREDGTDLTGVFFENQNELWNPDRTEVTLIVDPGRVKTGLLAHQKWGRAFEEGKRYTLMVDVGPVDFENQRLAQAYRKTFTAVKEDVQAPDARLWRLHRPRAHTKEPLVVEFHEVIDHISAQTLVSVLRKGQRVRGRVVLSQAEQRWTFTPQQPWQKEPYLIAVEPQLEDMAANSLQQVFDHQPAQAPVRQGQKIHFIPEGGTSPNN